MERKTVFISGCDKGIGKEIVRVFSQKGWDIVAHARKDDEIFRKFLIDLAEENNTSITPIFFDLRDEETIKQRIREEIVKPKVKIDAIVNNAGICEIKLFMLNSIESIKEVFEVNLFSHMKITQMLVKRLNEGGAITNISSVDGINPNSGESAYASSKAALIAWTKVMAKEFTGRIRVNAVAPYAVDTDLASQIKEKASWDEEKLIKPESVAKMVFYLTSEATDVTGEVITIAGKKI